jgi:hypothetical protein
MNIKVLPDQKNVERMKDRDLEVRKRKFPFFSSFSLSMHLTALIILFRINIKEKMLTETL